MGILDRKKDKRSYSEDEKNNEINQLLKIENFMNDKFLFTKVFDLDNPEDYVWKLGAMGKLIKDNIKAAWKNNTVVALNNILETKKTSDMSILDMFSEIYISKKKKIPFGINRISEVRREQFQSDFFSFTHENSCHINMEYFVIPSSSNEMLSTWNDFTIEFLKKIGLTSDFMLTTSQNIVDHPSSDDYFFDRFITQFKYPFGLETIFTSSDRIDFYFENHDKSFSEDEIDKLRIFDDLRNEKLLPHMISINIDVDKLVLALIFNGYDEFEVRNSKMSSLTFAPQVAPVKCCIFPKSSVDRMVQMRSEKLHTDFNKEFKTLMDDKGTIEIRTFKFKEIGVPYFIIVDPELLEDDLYIIQDNISGIESTLSKEDIIFYIKNKIKE
ncbi:MAG: hypothetical protein PF638_00495 [Candidatus Delongbacteria bacterium]|jgi:glycyl-tRNA synthetase|nr:hypothetical protein [Candidatus Delongbacteria bacterium]